MPIIYMLQINIFQPKHIQTTIVANFYMISETIW